MFHSNVFCGTSSTPPLPRMPPTRCSPCRSSFPLRAAVVFACYIYKHIYKLFYGCCGSCAPDACCAGVKFPEITISVMRPVRTPACSAQASRVDRQPMHHRCSVAQFLKSQNLSSHRKSHWDENLCARRSSRLSGRSRGSTGASPDDDLPAA